MTTPGQGPAPSGVNSWTGQVPSGVVTVSVMFGMASVVLLPPRRELFGVDPLRPATPRLRSPLAFIGVDPLRPATPRLRSPLAFIGVDPLRPATPRLRSPLS